MFTCRSILYQFICSQQRPILWPPLSLHWIMKVSTLRVIGISLTFPVVIVIFSSKPFCASLGEKPLNLLPPFSIDKGASTGLLSGPTRDSLAAKRALQASFLHVLLETWLAKFVCTWHYDWFYQDLQTDWAQVVCIRWFLAVFQASSSLSFAFLR